MKLYLLIITIIITPLFCAAQSDMGELKGVVTFNTDNGRQLADAGAEVIIYLIDSVKTPDKYKAHHAEDSMINNSFLATIYYEEYAHTPIGKTQKHMIRKLKALDAYPEEDLHELDNMAAEKIRTRESKQCARIITDKSGAYSVMLHVGYYGIIFRSRHLHSRTKAEGNGNILLDEIVVQPRTTITKNEVML